MGNPWSRPKWRIEALEFIENLKLNPYEKVEVGKHVIVVGAGNTAIDCVTQAKRLGAEKATIVYRRSAEDMSCYNYEYELGKSDGCEFRFSTSPVRVVGDVNVEGLECVKVELGEPTNGASLQIVEGSEFVYLDMIIYATGQEHWKGLVDSVPGMEGR